MHVLLSKPGIEEKNVSDGMKKLLISIQGNYYIDAQEDIEQIRASIHLLYPGPDKEKERNEIFKILDGLYWDTDHHFNNHFKQKNMLEKYHELYALLTSPETEGTLKERLLQLRSNIYVAYFNLCQKSDEDMKDVLILYSHKLLGYAKEVKEHENPQVYKNFQVANSDFSRAVSFLPQLKIVTGRKDNKPRPYSKDDIKKIEDEFASFFQSFELMITEIDRPIPKEGETPNIITAEEYAKDEPLEDIQEERLRARCDDKLRNKNMTLQQIADSEQITREKLEKLLFG